MKKNNNIKKNGFTLLEIIVSLGIFAIVSLLSVGTLLSLTDAQRKAFALQNAFDNLRFSLEVIGKDIRTGDFYYCGATLSDIPITASSRDCISGGPSLTYEDADGNLITYQYNSALKRIDKKKNGLDDGFLTAPEDINIDALVFYVFGSLLGDKEQPRVTILVDGRTGQGRSAKTFSLQTSVNQLLRRSDQ